MISRTRNLRPHTHNPQNRNILELATVYKTTNTFETRHYEGNSSEMAAKKLSCCEFIEVGSYYDDKSPHFSEKSHRLLQNLIQGEVAGQVMCITNVHHTRILLASQFRATLIKITKQPKESTKHGTREVNYLLAEMDKGRKYPAEDPGV